ncbi:MAG TPA: PEP-CTERM sorting domain-containing protein [Bryobacteraceae bacterium]|jgi:hypothetical protein|nr:PEP-CTERM sorting domain-containing protein [Bryobacteraceae bacterium]
MSRLVSNIMAAAALTVALGSGAAFADSLSASLYSPTAPTGTLTPIVLSGLPTGNSNIVGSGFTVDFNVASNQGVVQGASSGNYAIPVAGVSGGQPLYLTGDYGSALTSNPAASGNYLSTGTGTITITFATPERSLALLWGSIDTGNSITLNDAANFTVTGADVQKAASGFVSNGYQGAGGSAYVIINTATPFTTLTATSSVISFEFAGVAGSSSSFTATPEPSSLALLGFGGALAGFGIRRRLKA